jgi:hypothetical protein
VFNFLLVQLEFSWTHVPFVFSSIQPYPPVAIAVFFNLKFVWGGAPPPLSSGVCHTLAPDGCLPLSKHTGGGGTTLAFPAHLFIYSSCDGLPLPPSSGAFLLTATVTSFPLSKVAGKVPPLLLSLASLFIYSLPEGLPLPHSPEVRAPHSLYYVSFFFSYLFIIQFVFFSFFPPGWGSVCPGGCAVCGSIMCCLAHLVVCFSQAG